MVATLRFTLWLAVAVVAAAVLGWLFRAVLTRIAPANAARLLRSAPLSASFGMAVIVFYLLVAILAPTIAPFGEREVVGAQFMPARQLVCPQVYRPSAACRSVPPPHG